MRLHQKFTFLPVNIVSSKLALEVSNSIPRNPPFCCYASFLIVSQTPFINKPDFSSDFTFFIISFILSIKVIIVVKREAKYKGYPNPKIFLRISTSAADTTPVILMVLKHF